MQQRPHHYPPRHPQHPQQYPPPYPPGQGYPQQQHDQQQPYQEFRRKNTIAPVTIVLGVLCLVLFIGVMVIFGKMVGISDELDQKVAINNDLTKKNMDLQKENEFYKTNRQAGQAAYKPEAALSNKDPQYWYDRCMKLEKDLSAAIKDASYLKQHMSKADLKQLQEGEDLTVQNYEMKPNADGYRLTFDVVNKAPKHISNVVGNVRIWSRDRIVAEYPFHFTKIEANSKIPWTIQLPKMGFEFTYEGSVKGGGSY